MRTKSTARGGAGENYFKCLFRHCRQNAQLQSESSQTVAHQQRTKSAVRIRNPCVFDVAPPPEIIEHLSASHMRRHSLQQRTTAGLGRRVRVGGHETSSSREKPRAGLRITETVPGSGAHTPCMRSRRSPASPGRASHSPARSAAFPGSAPPE